MVKNISSSPSTSLLRRSDYFTRCRIFFNTLLKTKKFNFTKFCGNQKFFFFVFFFMKTMTFISHKKSIIYRWCISTSLCNSTLKNSIYTIYQIFSLFLIYLKCLPSDSFRCIYNSNTNTWHCVTIIHLVVKKYHLLKTLYLIHCWSYKKMIFMHRLKTWGDVGIYLFYKNIKMFITRKKLSNFSISITKIILTCLIMHYLFSKNTITHYLFKFIYNNKNLVKILPLEEFQFS